MGVASLTDLANLALSSIGVGAISNISDSSKQAVACNRWIDMAIRKALSRGEFSTTFKRAPLTLLSQWNRQDFQYQYQLPNDYIKSIKLDTEEAFEIEGGFLYTGAVAHQAYQYDSGTTTTVSVNPTLIYVAYPQNLNTLQPYVADYIAAQLAYMIAPDLLNDMNKVQLAASNLQASYVMAKGHNLSEKKGKQMPPKKWSDY